MWLAKKRVPTVSRCLREKLAPLHSAAAHQTMCIDYQLSLIPEMDCLLPRSRGSPQSRCPLTANRAKALSACGAEAAIPWFSSCSLQQFCVKKPWGLGLYQGMSGLLLLNIGCLALVATSRRRGGRLLGRLLLSQSRSPLPFES